MHQWDKFVQAHDLFKGRDMLRIREAALEWQENRFTQFMFEVMDILKHERVRSMQKPIKRDDDAALHNLNLGYLNALKELRGLAPDVIETVERAVKNEGA